MHVATAACDKGTVAMSGKRVKPHIPALRMRRIESHTLPGKMLFRLAHSCAASSALTSDSQQHQLLALQTQMHRIGAQPATLIQPSNAAEIGAIGTPVWHGTPNNSLNNFPKEEPINPFVLLPVEAPRASIFSKTGTSAPTPAEKIFRQK